MRIIFAGTPVFAAESLSALLLAGFNVVLVLTQPDRPAGRGLAMQSSAVKTLAESKNIPVLQPRGLRLDGRYAEEASSVQRALQASQADVMVVVAYGLILPASILGLFPKGCLNIHASLLPRWRGAAPIQRAILSGDTQTGVDVMQMDVGLDTGAVVSRRVLNIEPTDTAQTLHDRLAQLGANLIVETLHRLMDVGVLPGTLQSENGVTYADKLARSEAPLDWSRSAQALSLQVRAFNPFPGATVLIRGVSLKVWVAVAEHSDGLVDILPGTVLVADAHGIVVACSQGVLRILSVQRSGGQRLEVGTFLRGFQIAQGECFVSVS